MDEDAAAEREAAEDKRLETEAKHSRVMVALHHTNNMQQGSYPEELLDKELLEQGKTQQEPEDHIFSEYQYFKSTLPPVNNLSTNTFVKLGQSNRSVPVSVPVGPLPASRVSESHRLPP